MVATQEATATRIGARGAAAAAATPSMRRSTVGFALAVTLPQRRQSRRRRLHAGARCAQAARRSRSTIARRPAATRFATCSWTSSGEADPEKSRYSGLARRRARHRRRPGAGARALRHDQPGARRWRRRSRSPEQGIDGERRTAGSLDGADERLQQMAVLERRIFCKAGGAPYAAGRHAGAARPRSVAQADRRAGAERASTAGRSARRSSPRWRARAAT